MLVLVGFLSLDYTHTHTHTQRLKLCDCQWRRVGSDTLSIYLGILMRVLSNLGTYSRSQIPERVCDSRAPSDCGSFEKCERCESGCGSGVVEYSLELPARASIEPRRLVISCVRSSIRIRVCFRSSALVLRGIDYGFR